jgi:transposase-like protein
MSSTVGRPRILTDAQVKAILAWYRSRKSLKQVAREYGVSTNTIQNVIRRKGEYKRPSPESREAAVKRRHRRIKELEGRYLL